MRLIALSVLAFTLAFASAEASRYIEPAMQQAGLGGYQYDGGVEQDASDHCRAPRPLIELGSTTSGATVPVDDAEDNYLLRVPPTFPGSEITIAIQPSPLVAEITESMGVAFKGPGPNYDLEVYALGCGRLLGASYASGSQADSVTFPRDPSGAYVVRVLTGPLSIGSPGVAPILPPLTEPRECHGICMTKFNALFGYSLTSGAN